MTTEKEHAIVDDLIALANEGLPLVGHGAIVYQNRLKAHPHQGRRSIAYLSGVPYLWSSFAERAFRFASFRQATEFTERYPELENILISNLEEL